MNQRWAKLCLAIAGVCLSAVAVLHECRISAIESKRPEPPVAESDDYWRGVADGSKITMDAAMGVLSGSNDSAVVIINSTNINVITRTVGRHSDGNISNLDGRTIKGQIVSNEVHFVPTTPDLLEKITDTVTNKWYFAAKDGLYELTNGLFLRITNGYARVVALPEDAGDITVISGPWTNAFPK